MRSVLLTTMVFASIGAGDYNTRDAYSILQQQFTFDKEDVALRLRSTEAQPNGASPHIFEKVGLLSEKLDGTHTGKGVCDAVEIAFFDVCKTLRKRGMPENQLLPIKMQVNSVFSMLLDNQVVANVLLQEYVKHQVFL